MPRLPLLAALTLLAPALGCNHVIPATAEPACRGLGPAPARRKGKWAAEAE